jgi:hypothetical protein
MLVSTAVGTYWYGISEMNRLEELLVILSEECAEVQQASSKCIRFGMRSTYELLSNKERLEYELGDFMAMLRLVVEEGNLSMDAIIAAADEKLIKVEKFMRNPKGLGAAEMADAFSRNPLPPLPSIDNPKNRAKIAR